MWQGTFFFLYILPVQIHDWSLGLHCNITESFDKIFFMNLYIVSLRQTDILWCGNGISLRVFRKVVIHVGLIIGKLDLKYNLVLRINVE